MPKSKEPMRRPTRQERVAAWVALTVFFGSLVGLLVENVAFDNTIGKVLLVGIGVAVALLIGIPGVVVIRRLDFASRDRWAACIFLVLGLCFACVSATTFVNRYFGKLPVTVVALVLDKEYDAPTRKAGPQYWLKLRLLDREVWIRVESDDFDTATIGRTYTTHVEQGALGLPVIGCEDCF